MADALSSAATGAALGSIVPGVGTLIGAVGGGLAGILGGVIGGIAGAGQRQAAMDAINKANDLIQQLGLPADQATPIILNQLREAGIADPAILNQVSQATTAYANIAPDTQNIEAQQKALQALQERGTVGLNAEDRAGLQNIRNQVSADAEARRKQILQNMQAMGQGGGGAALAAQLASAQSASNTESQQANAQAATAAQRALQAIQASGNLAGEVRNQNFNVASTRAQAQDAMNRFNIGNQLNVGQANQNAQQQANMYNAQNQQNISNQNVANSNAELYRQAQGRQIDFQNAQNLAQTKANSLGNIANAQNGQAANTGQMISGIAGGVATGLGGYGQYLNNQDSAKAAANQQNIVNQQNQQALDQNGFLNKFLGQYK